MAGLAVKYTDNMTAEIMKLAVIFPELGKATLGRLGYMGTGYLRKELLSGQALNVKDMNSEIPTDKAGHKMVRFAVNKRGSHVKIFAYPVNLFEKGRGLPGGGREPGRYILTKKLKAIMETRIDSDITVITRKTYESRLKKMGF